MKGAILLGMLACTAAQAAPPRTIRIAAVDTLRALPPDLLQPEGRTRWDLTATPRGAEQVRTLAAPAGTEQEAWLLPDSDRPSLRPGERRVRHLSDGTEAEVVTVGIGWVHLPSGAYEVCLQRVRLHSPAGDVLLHRWVDAGAGTVAEIRGPASPDGARRLRATEGFVLESVLAGASIAKIYVQETEGTPFDRISYGWDRGKGTTVSQLTPEGYATIGDLVAASSWDFSGTTINSATQIAGTTTANNATTINGTGTAFASDLEVGDRVSLGSAPTTFARVLTVPSATQITVDAPLGNGTTQTIRRRVREAAATTAPVNASESCNAARCGYTAPGAVLERRDVRFDSGNVKFNNVSQRENRATDVTLWLRAGAQKEGRTGTFGTGESRFCFQTDATGTRSPVPEWQFQHQDAGGWYMQPGDVWEGGPFNCEQNLFNQTCGTAQVFDLLYAKACGTHTGKQGATVLKSGVLTLPSGHTFNSLLVRQMSDFCVYLAAGCNAIFKVDEVRTVVYLWQVPHLGTPVLIQSVQNAADATSWSAVDQTDIKFGLFPPVTIATTGRTDTTRVAVLEPGERHATDRRVQGLLGRRLRRGLALRLQLGDPPGTGHLRGDHGHDLRAPAGNELLLHGDHTVHLHRSLERRRDDLREREVSDAGVRRSRPRLSGGGPADDHVHAGSRRSPGCGWIAIPPGSRSAGIRPPTPACRDTTCSDRIPRRPRRAGPPLASVTGTTCWTGNPSQRYLLAVVRGVGATGPWGHYGN